MNPYRITYSKFLDPASPYSRSRVYRAVKELKENYNISGIHFDDYFYHSTSKYLYTTEASRYSKNPKGTLRSRKGITAAEKRKNCNLLVKGVYKKSHAVTPAKNCLFRFFDCKVRNKPCGQLFKLHGRRSRCQNMVQPDGICGLYCSADLLDKHV